MTDKERLFDVKNNSMFGIGHRTVTKENFLWLIEQAERVQELEEHHDRWLSGQNMAVNHYNDFRQLKERSKRYQDALQEVNRILEFEASDRLALNTIKDVVTIVLEESR